MLIRHLLANLRARFLPFQTHVAAPSHVEPEQDPQLQLKPEPTVPLSAVAIFEMEPGLTPAELAARAGVTLSYARSLVRRRNAKRSPAIVRTVVGEPSVAVLQTQVRDLARRVEKAETRESRTAAPLAVARRSQVLDRNAAGVPVNIISDELGIPLGEAEFILKMDRLKKSLKN